MGKDANLGFNAGCSILTMQLQMLDNCQYCHIVLELSIREITQQIARNERHLLKSMPAVHSHNTAIPAAGNRLYNQLCSCVNIEGRTALHFLWDLLIKGKEG